NKKKEKSDVDDDDSSDEEEEMDLDEANACSRSVLALQNMFGDWFKKHHEHVWTAFWIVLGILYIAYLAYSFSFRFGDEGSWRLLICTLLGVILLVFHLLDTYCNFNLRVILEKALDEVQDERRDRLGFWINIIVSILLVLGAIIFIIVEIALKTPRNLVSLLGMFCFILIFYICSKHPARVKWRPVFWGLALQFYFALIILRWRGGYQAFKYLGDRVSEFLAYTDAGSIFVFGEKYTDHFFAFKVLTVIVFFSTAISILYYLGVMQFIIRNLARFMAAVMGTSPAESLNAAGNIFIGQSEAPLMIRPFLHKMTKSEMHAICTGGFATIAGSVMAAYILYDVPANHLLSASVMSAPAALAMSKLFWPETKKSRAGDEVYNIASGQERNIIEAASRGATQSTKLIANIAVNLIAFIALLKFVDSTLIWFGNRAGFEKPGEEWSFSLICSYVFSPISYVMGVEWDDCRKVAEMIGLKTFLNEFIAYTELSKYIKNQQNLTWYEYLPFNTSIVNNNYTGNWTMTNGNIVYLDFDHTLVGGVLSDRSVVISTYALCGFSNIGSMGIMLGALGAMAPNRMKALVQVVFRAMIAGNVACFMTACIAGK
ncbi:hypothetical protein FSP39_024723, partial [Pinctada imbricata]